MSGSSVGAALGVAAAIVGLTTFAIAQPMLDILGSNAEFFVAHGASARQVVTFALVVFFVPPAVLMVVIGGLTLWSRAVARLALTAVGAALTAVTVVHVLPGGLRDRPLLYSAVFVGVVGLAGWLFLSTKAMRSFWLAMGCLSPAVLVAFLFFSPASGIVFADDVEVVGAGAASDDDLVLVVLDELSLAAVIGADGELDRAKVPNLARLAQSATFYANTTTVSHETVRSVPSILSGQVAEPGQLPLASEFPQNLFTLLAPSHELVVDEIVTQLCPEGVCADAGDERSTAQLYDDARVVYLHTLLPARWASAWLPDITTQWAGFGEDLGPELAIDEPSYIAVLEEVADDQAARAAAFIDRLASRRDGPRFEYVHLAVPHVPYTYLPDGRRYNGAFLDGLSEGEWSNDVTEVDMADFRYQLQVGYVDRLIGEMIDSLHESGRFERSMIVLVSDHGVAHRAGLPRRIPTAETLGDLAWVPLVIKYPGQQEPRVIDEPASTIDIAPTVADALGVALAEPVDGRSLLGEVTAVARQLVGYPEWDLDADAEADVAEAIARIHRSVPAGLSAADAYGLGELQGATGRHRSSLQVADAAPVTPADGLVTLDGVEALQSVELGGDVLPVLLRARVEGLAPGDHVALFLDDVLAGSGRVNEGGDRLVVMLDPTTLTDGLNEPSAALVSDGPVFEPIPVAGLGYELQIDDGRIGAVTSERRQWDTETRHRFAMDVAPGRDEVIVGWVARCEGGSPAAEALVLVVDGRPVPATFERIERPDIACLDQPAPVGFAVRVAPELADARAAVTVVALFDDGTFTLLE